ncbi:MAG: hypothetical protein QFB86_03740 [Patescibacteria group bacterium]|nr:hypothetical protein [Patescibacteria group bacterium]
MHATTKKVIYGLLVIGIIFSQTSVIAYAAEKTPAKATAAVKAKPTDISGAVSTSYNADKAIQIGMIVELKPKDAKSVLALNNKHMKQAFGIVIPVSKAPIVLAPTVAQQQQVLVATSGRQTALVSNQNGPIKIGDYVTISAIDGIGMKASESEEQVMGKAASAFNGTANVAGTVKLKDNAGHESSVTISRIQVDVNITHNPLFAKSLDQIPGFMTSVAVAVSGKPVSVARIYLSTLILFITAIVSGVMLYSGVRSGMISVGRNPLSKKSIIASLIQTVLAGLIIFFAGIFAVYLVLKL